jgi:hypothetical protein
MRILPALVIVTAATAACKSSSRRRPESRVSGSVTVGGAPAPVRGCTVARVDGDNRVTFVLADDTRVTKVPEGLEVVRGGATETIACADFAMQSTGSFAGDSAHEKGELSATCGDYALDLDFDCRN